MKVNVAIEHMSKLYLDKVINSFSNDIKKFSEQESRDFIHKNSKDFLQKGHFEERLLFRGESYKERLLLRLLIEFLLMKRGYEVEESKLHKAFIDYHADWLRKIKNKEITSHIPKEKYHTLKVLLEVILEDGKVSADEEKILLKLIERFELTEIEMHAVGFEVSKEFYPSVDQKVCESLIKTLMSQGVVYYLNKDIDNKRIIIPEEIAKIIAVITRYPLDKKSFELLFASTSKDSLIQVAKHLGLPISGSKQSITDRLWAQGYKAEKLLDLVDVGSLRAIARPIENVKVSGRKEEVIQNILTHFFNLETDPINTPKKQDIKALWEYFQLFGNRDYTKLRQLKLIKKDLDIEHLFEKLTIFAFNTLGKNKLQEFEGNNNPDGSVIGLDKKVMLWDNKSQETEYIFPNSHQKQFLQYVKKSASPVSSFLIITGTIGDHKSIVQSCIIFESQSGCNVAVIEAEIFKVFMDSLEKKNLKKSLNPQVFNHNGILDLQVLEQRFGVFN